MPHKSMRPQRVRELARLRRCLRLANACAIIDMASPVSRISNPYAVILTCSSRTPPYRQRPHAEGEA